MAIIDWARGGEMPCRWTAARLVVRFQHLHPMCIVREANVGNKRTTSKLMILVEFLNLTFDFVIGIKRGSNVKFIPLDCMRSLAGS